MKSFPKIILFLLLLISYQPYAQHYSKLTVEFIPEKNKMNVNQELTFFNQTSDTISTLVLNDWNNAYSDKNSLLGQRFSDEFVRSFHLAKDKERGSTDMLTIMDDQAVFQDWCRPDKNVDLIEVQLRDKILPNEKRTFRLTYFVKIPSDRFTNYGYNSKGGFVLKNWFLTPARYENREFIRYSNADLDDIANGIFDIDLNISVPSSFQLNTDLDEIKREKLANQANYTLTGKSRTDFSLFIESKSDFYSYKNDLIEVETDLKDTKVSDVQKAIIIDKIIEYAKDHIGAYPFQKITISHAEYDRNPFYGLNQLPSFISIFPDEFIYELKFFKTFINSYLKNTLHLDGRKDAWIIDGIQMYMLMNYIDENHPNFKMMGGLSKLKLLKSFNIMNVDFNEQYSYYYMLMARKNLDQPLNNSKETLIRFNEKIASKYRAGLSLKYLDNYTDSERVSNSIKEFYSYNSTQQSNAAAFETILRKNIPQNIDWFFKTIINSRDIIDYKFSAVSKTKDSITFTVKNRTGTTVPIPVYGLKDKQIVFKKWFENIRTDSTFTVDRQQANKIVLNYNNEVPEYNLRNNWNSFHSIFFNNRPFKFVFLKDLEDPYYNQILYVPTVTFNLYDGIAPGFRFHNKTILNKTFNYDVNPIYSSKTNQLRGTVSLAFNQMRRNSRLFFIRYSLSSSYFNYAPDASFFKLNPSLVFNIREDNLRANRKQFFILRHNIVQKQESKIVIDSSLSNYSVFNLKYINSNSELTHHFNVITDLQLSSSFGKTSAEIQYRKLYDNNRQINLRLFAGSLLYNSTSNSNTFNFGLSNLNDYLFEQALLGRSEQTGVFSQQYIQGEGGFKSKVLPVTVDQWLITTNVSFNVWNWIEVYGDLGLVKNNNFKEKWVYDNGIRLNFVPDYFELYFPIYSNNGWEISQPQYSEKIRIVFTLNPKALVNLFTRKWL